MLQASQVVGSNAGFSAGRNGRISRVLGTIFVFQPLICGKRTAGNQQPRMVEAWARPGSWVPASLIKYNLDSPSVLSRCAEEAARSSSGGSTDQEPGIARILVCDVNCWRRRPEISSKCAAPRKNEASRMKGCIRLQGYPKSGYMVHAHGARRISGVSSHNLAIFPWLCPSLRPARTELCAPDWSARTLLPILFSSPSTPSPSPITPHSLIRSSRSSPHIGFGHRSTLSPLTDGRQLAATVALTPDCVVVIIRTPECSMSPLIVDSLSIRPPAPYGHAPLLQNHQLLNGILFY